MLLFTACTSHDERTQSVPFCEQSDDAGSSDCVTPSFVSEAFDGCLFGSPLAFDGPDGPEVVVVSGDGRVAAISQESGSTRFDLRLPSRSDRMTTFCAFR